MSSLHHCIKATILLTIFLLPVSATKVIRGPYLQKLTDSSITMRFLNDKESKVFVKYGKDKKNLNLRQENFLFTDEHIIEINKLEPNTKYFYEIYEESSRGDNKLSTNKNYKYFFETAPKPGAQEHRANIWLLGDPGVSAEKEFSKRVRGDQQKVKIGFLDYLKKNKIKKPDLMVTLGDNVYSFGTEEEFQKGFFDVYEKTLINTPLFTTFGNHDAGIRKDFVAFSARSYPKPRGTYYDIFSLPGKKAYYSFNYGDAHFVILDSFDSIWEEALGETEGNEKIWTQQSQKSNPMLSWLENDLKNSKSTWNIVICHHPPYADEDDSSEKKELWKAWMNAYAVPIIEKYKTDLVISGHVHNYQRMYPLESKLAKEAETQITKKEKSEMDEATKYSYFYSRGETTVNLKLPKYIPVIKSSKKYEYSKNEGTIYMLVGSSGSAFKKILKKPNPNFVTKAQVAGSLLLTVEPNLLTVKFITRDSEVFDEFSISYTKS